jgi:hypothetical protein
LTTKEQSNEAKLCSFVTLLLNFFNGLFIRCNTRARAASR